MDKEHCSVYGHPALLHTPADFDALEQQTGMRATREGNKVRMVPLLDDYESNDRLSYVGNPTAFAEVFGRIA